MSGTLRNILYVCLSIRPPGRICQQLYWRMHNVLVFRTDSNLNCLPLYQTSRQDLPAALLAHAQCFGVSHRLKLKLFFKCGNDIIETTDNYEHLKLNFRKSGNFTALDHLANQANKAAQVCIKYVCM